MAGGWALLMWTCGVAAGMEAKADGEMVGPDALCGHSLRSDKLRRFRRLGWLGRVTPFRRGYASGKLSGNGDGDIRRG